MGFFIPRFRCLSFPAILDNLKRTVYFSGIIDHETRASLLYPPIEKFQSTELYIEDRYFSKSHLKLKAHEIPFAYNLIVNGAFLSKISTEHGIDTAVAFAKCKKIGLLKRV